MNFNKKTGIARRQSNLSILKSLSSINNNSTLLSSSKSKILILSKNEKNQKTLKEYTLTNSFPKISKSIKTEPEPNLKIPIQKLKLNSVENNNKIESIHSKLFEKLKMRAKSINKKKYMFSNFDSNENSKIEQLKGRGLNLNNENDRDSIYYYLKDEKNIRNHKFFFHKKIFQKNMIDLKSLQMDSLPLKLKNHKTGNETKKIDLVLNDKIQSFLMDKEKLGSYNKKEEDDLFQYVEGLKKEKIYMKTLN